MKKQVKIALISVVAVILMFVVIIITTNTNKMPFPKDGTYRITGTDSYPGAYVIVTKGTIQFFSIDLNQFYKQKYTEAFIKLQDRGVISGYTEAELAEYADVNKLFVDNAFPLKKAIVSQENTNLYRYHCATFINANGMTFFYDVQKQQVYFCTNDGDFYFQKEK